MTLFHNSLILPALAGLGLAALGGGFALANPGTATQVPFRCGVVAAPQGGMTRLEAVVETDAALSGTYTLAVDSASGGGRSRVNQGGPFALGAGEAATLGTVTIGTGAATTIVFDLDIDGTVWSCAPVSA